MNVTVKDEALFGPNGDIICHTCKVETVPEGLLWKCPQCGVEHTVRCDTREEYERVDAARQRALGKVG